MSSLAEIIVARKRAKTLGVRLPDASDEQRAALATLTKSKDGDLASSARVVMSLL